MATGTSKFSFIKPAVNDPTDADRWGNQLNATLDSIDTEVYEGQFGLASYAVSAGASANTYEVSYTPNITVLTAGLELKFKAHQDNTGASTLNVNTLGAIAIKKDVSFALEAGDIKNGLVVSVVYDGSVFQLQSRPFEEANVITTRGDLIRGDSAGSAERLAVGTAGQQVLSNGTDALWGFPYTNYQVFDAAGASTFTTPAGVSKVMVACWGAGGGGKGASSSFFSGTWFNSPGVGGGGGGFAFGIVDVSGSITVDIGAGGAGSAGSISASAGGDGGTTTFNSTSPISATGGTGGGSTSAGGVGSGGMFNARGNFGKGGNQTNHGGSVALIGLFGLATTGVGGNGVRGGGGAGGYVTDGNPRAGGNGGDGLVIVFW